MSGNHLSSDHGLVLIGFGGPEHPDDVLPFLRRVTAGRDVPAHRLATVAAHYEQFGGVSPLNAQNRALLAALREALAPLPVEWGNRNAAPWLPDALTALRGNGVQRAFAFVTSPFGSYPGCRQYQEDIAAAVGQTPMRVDKLRAFYNHPGFLHPVADRVRAALDQVPPDSPVVFTAHSLPTASAAGSPYVAQLRESARLVMELLGDSRPWELGWQSRSGSATVPWLAPDLRDVLLRASQAGAEAVVIVPIGFVSDHMEVVYDLDIEAVSDAGQLGIRVVRAGTVGVDARFVEMVGELIAERVRGVPRRALGRRGPSHDGCPSLCCPPLGSAETSAQPATGTPHPGG